MNLQSTINHLEAYLRGEVESKRHALTCIEAQEAAIQANDPAALERAIEQTAASYKKCEATSARRTKLLQDLADHWRIPVGVLTLGGIVRRLGKQAGELGPLREELRGLMAEVIKRNRRLAALIGMHRRINTDLMQLLVGCDSPEDVQAGGTLVNAEA